MSAAGLISGTAAAVGPGTRIDTAAEQMTRDGRTALPVMDDGHLLGLVTDHDLRARCLAAGRSPEEPVGQVMDPEPVTVQAEAPGFEVLLAMVRQGVQHLVVLEQQRVIGIVSAADLLRHQAANAQYLARDALHCGSVEELTRLAVGLPDLQVRLVKAGITARLQGIALTAVVDALTRRLIELAESTMGASPGPFAWLACGSQGRREQVAHTDQDNALIFADGLAPGADAWFRELGERVTDGLDACAIPHCPGGVSPRSTGWRRSVAGWRRQFRDTIEHPSPKAVMLASHYFDLRVVHGDASLFEPLWSEARQLAAGNSRFLARVTDNALRAKAGLGWFRRLKLVRGGDRAGTLNLKQQGLLPISQLALSYAVRTGMAPVGTLERLAAAAAAGIISPATSDDLCYAYETLAAERACHLTRRFQRGEAADNFLRPDEIPDLALRHLKDVLARVASAQRPLRQWLQGGSHG